MLDELVAPITVSAAALTAVSVEEQLRESEQRYRQLAELSPDAYFLHSDGRVLFVNQAGLSLLGASDRSEVCGKPVYDFVDPSFHNLVLADACSNSQAATPPPLSEQTYVRLDGSKVDVEVAALRSSYMGHPAVQVVARDIRERKRAEELQVRALSAEQGERQRANLLSTVSHELRTPLTAVRGYATTILEYMDKLEPREIEDCVRGIDSAAIYLEKIVSDLLTMTRIESGVLHLASARFTSVCSSKTRSRPGSWRCRGWPSGCPCLHVTPRCASMSCACSRWSTTWWTTRSSTPAPANRSTSRSGSGRSRW